MMYEKTEASDVSQEVTPASERLSPKGIAAMQGMGDGGVPAKSPDTSPPNMTIAASEFKPETQAALKEQNLDDPNDALADNTGKKAESVTRTVLRSEGLPDGSGGVQCLKDVIPGHYDNKGSGIDLIGVTADGRPIPIEVKKRAGDQDSMGRDTVPLENMEPETLALKEDILREREVNPAMQGEGERRLTNGKPDQDLSTDQMAGLWSRDRWLKLIKNDERRAELAQAGVSKEFLNLDNLKAADSPQWRTFLDGRTTVVVSGARDDVTNVLFQEAVFERGCNVAFVNLKA
jgi:hypothetical protein